MSPAGQREDGEGWDREQAKRLEERNKWFEAGGSAGGSAGEVSSRWDSMELRRADGPGASGAAEVSRKWAELETLSFRDMDQPPSAPQEAESPARPPRSPGGAAGSQTASHQGPPGNGAATLQRSAAARQQEVRPSDVQEGAVEEVLF